ncbi:MAG: hypothetical protein DI551_07945 [Micavibrio aeruginosavorus]|uniref:Uncharacterized protein n=1 Tax=Micavibrio aeruginosavorus TaxID=349221 RepID=A0A2W5MVB5_9BACT|nr:MAG: hypothetical protein DI551_07945 [Micavibrio aeruginosavorus]
MNVVKFPVLGERYAEPEDPAELLLAVANMLRANADRTNFPLWMEQMSFQCRRMSKRIRAH